MNIELRAATASDDPFLRQLHREAMGPHVEATWGAWDPEAQAKRFEKAPVSEHLLVLINDRPVGCLLVSQDPDAVVLSRVWITPEAQNQGIGTHLILQVCHRAAMADRIVRLRVLKANPAHRLYARLGFVVVAEGPTHFVMERTVARKSSASGPVLKQP
jgi:ribosomal protein S18 acetylase RimI-like enzyme